MTPNEQFIQDVAEAVAQKMAHLVGRKSERRLLDLEGAAEYLSRTIRSIRHLIDKGVIPRVIMDGRVYIDIRDLDRIIDQSKERAAA